MRSTRYVAPLALSFALLTACTASVSTQTMTITSGDFADGGSIPSEFTCDGHSLRPEIRISGVPNTAASLAIILHDPDAPGGEFIHWTAWNIDPTTADILSTDALPGATEGPNGSGTAGYKGPCPPTGTHHYIFTLYAVSKMLTLSTTATAPQLRDALAGNVITQAELTGLYARTGNSASPSDSSEDSSESSSEIKTAPGATIPPQY